MARPKGFAAVAGTIAGTLARALVRNHLNVAAMLGIFAMTVGAWLICGAAIAFAVFGGFTWLTTLIAAELATRAKREAS